MRFGDNTSVHVLRGFRRMATENIVFIYISKTVKRRVSSFFFLKFANVIASFPGGSEVKNPLSMQGDAGLIPR